MKRHILFILLVFSAYLLLGSTWIRSYPWLDLCTQSYTSAQARAYNVIPAIGGGYLLQGHVEFFHNDSMRLVENVFWKIDENGNLIWRRLGNDMLPYNIVISNGTDRYYCIRSYEHYSRLNVFDSELNQLGDYDFWQINGYPVYMSDAVLTSDGLVFAAKVDGNAVILKTDFEFNLIWQGDSYFTGYSDGYNTIKPYSGGWVGVSDRHFAHLSAIGDTIWTYTDSVNRYSFQDCIVTGDNQVFSIGYSMNTGAYRLFAIDPLVQSIIPIPINFTHGDVPDFPVSIIEGSNGEMIYLDLGTNNEVLHAYSRTGEHLWSRDFYPHQFYFIGKGASNLITSMDTSILFCAYYYGQIMLVKTDSNGNVVANNDPQHSPPAITVKHYPNPARTHLTIDYKAANLSSSLSLEIFNIRGQKIYSSPLKSKAGTIRIDILNNPVYNFFPGIYMYQIRDRNLNICASERFVVIR